MFAASYFAPYYFAPRYFPKRGASLDWKSYLCDVGYWSSIITVRS